MTRIAIIGGGSWGTALGLIAARNTHQVRLWSRNPQVVDSINHSHINAVYLAEVVLPDSLSATDRVEEAIAEAELVIFAAPSHATRKLLGAISKSLTNDMILVSATKGIEIATGKRISQLVSEIVGARFVCLSGPSFAKEVINGHPTAIVAAGADANDRHLVQTALNFENFRLYANDDVVGTELGGSLKNVIAIAAGMVVGLGFGTNTLAALITRGLAEMSRLALREGARVETLMGLAGLGDLVLTCTGTLSRNRYVGEELGKGRTLEDIVSGMNEVAEGINTALAVKNLAAKLGVEMPITDQICAVLYEDKSPRDAAIELMSRPLREE